MDSLIKKLSKKAIDLSGKSKKELERTCWMIVHEYKHGAMPTEYDIREIDEELYLEVLKIASKLKKRVVIGTTGFTKKEENLIKKYSKRIPSGAHIDRNTMPPTSPPCSR